MNIEETYLNYSFVMYIRVTNNSANTGKMYVPNT